MMEEVLVGKIFCITGKSGTGKDTVFNSIMGKKIPDLEPVVTYTTRPKRVNETEGREYHFTDNETLEALEREGRVIEKRTYHTVHGDWNYFTCEIDMSQSGDFIMIGTPDVVDRLYEHYDRDTVVVIYLELDDRERLLRCINREAQQKEPDYSEVCRRYLADEKDFFKGRSERYKFFFRINSFKKNEENVEECIDIIKKIRAV